MHAHIHIHIFFMHSMFPNFFVSRFIESSTLYTHIKTWYFSIYGIFPWIMSECFYSIIQSFFQLIFIVFYVQGARVDGQRSLSEETFESRDIWR